MNLEALKNKRKLLRQKNTRMTTFIQAAVDDTEKQKQIELRLQQYNSVLEDFLETEQKIEELEPTNEDEYTPFEDAYYENMAKATELIENMRSASGNGSSAPPSISSAVQNNVKLPTIELPTFDGEYSNWLAFRDVYQSLIHHNDALSNVQKLHYLKSCLKNSAASVIAAMPTTEDNYEIAWDLIHQRYENTKMLVKTRVDNMRGVHEGGRWVLLKLYF